ncbi:MAG: hypothetical protein HY790_08800 [Deltaproteobacteria bacterium]|nr:hypothetical protein [Deltaproteobacteria bacterium]MBI4795917.1 hypothetical protein [Deltaproteobacteria bacterium]
MLLNYREKSLLRRANWQPELAAMGITEEAVIEVIAREVAEKGEALISCYHFRTPSGEPGSILVCHHLGRGAISFGTNTRWGHWDETYEILTLEESGEKFNFDGKPVYEGDEGSCSLGNF